MPLCPSRSDSERKNDRWENIIGKATKDWVTATMNKHRVTREVARQSVLDEIKILTLHVRENSMKRVLGLLFSWLVVSLIIFTALTGHCSTVQQAQPQHNSIGFIPYYENPNEYMFASVSGLEIFKDAEGSLYTHVLFQPAHTYALFVEEVLFCGNVSRVFTQGALVITYEREAHHRFNGAACHELKSVNQVQEEELP